MWVCVGIPTFYIKFPVVFYRVIGYNKINLKCATTPVSFEPTDTLNGIPISPYRCQASGLWTLCSGRQKYGCGYPPSLARSQNTRSGILGIIQKKSSRLIRLLLLCMGLSDYPQYINVYALWEAHILHKNCIG